MLNDLCEKVLELYNAESGDNLTIDEITSYDMESHMIPWYVQKIEKYFIEAVPNVVPRDGAVELMQKLHDDGHEIYCVTTSHFAAMVVKEQWLYQYFPFIDHKHIIRLYKKQMLNCDLMVDDNIDNLVGGRYHKVLLDYAWNRDISDSVTGVFRVHNWEEIYKIITLLSKRGEIE